METKGIDVSYYQGNIDWQKVKAAGIKFAIIRAGFGMNNIDKKFTANIEGALNAGLEVGAYWFLYGLNANDIIKNAERFHEALSPYKDRITCKVWCDFEYDTDSYANKNGKVFTKQERTDLVKTFCKKMASFGYDVGVYANPDYLKTKFNDVSEYPLWLAYYTSNKGSYAPYMWQHSSKGSVNGISGNVDMNIRYDADVQKQPNPYAAPTRLLKRTSPMMKGEDVKWLQYELNANGYSLDVDGIFGDKTNNALLSYLQK